MRALLLGCLVMCATALSASPQSEPASRLMPMPATIEPGSGQLLIDRSFSISVIGYHDASLDRAIQRFLTQLTRVTGIPIWSKPGGSNPSLLIHADQARESPQHLGEDESYTLSVTPSHAERTAPNPLGILHGLETFR